MLDAAGSLFGTETQSALRFNRIFHQFEGIASETSRGSLASASTSSRITRGIT
jgi:hypothetical protein